MRQLFHWRGPTIALVFAVGLAAGARSQTAFEAEAPFLAENSAALERMMSDMDIKPTGNVDRDFAAMMIPHHQGAIDMAKALLRYGHNEQLRRIAQEIIVDQEQEIAVMRLALNQPLPPPHSASDEPPGKPAAGHPAHMHVMNMREDQ